MSAVSAAVAWSREDEPFTDNRYSRAHRWTFDGDLEVAASSSPAAVPVPMSDPAALDPEEAFVASLSSCHMLWFLSIAARRGFVVDDYRDDADGVLEAGPDGRQAMTRVTLRPRVRYHGAAPDLEAEDAMHHAAHESCFLAASVTSEITIEPVRP